MFFSILILFCIQACSCLIHLSILYKALPLSAAVRFDKVCLCEFLRMHTSNFLFKSTAGVLGSNCYMQICSWFGDVSVLALQWGNPVTEVLIISCCMYMVGAEAWESCYVPFLLARRACELIRKIHCCN